MNFFGFCIFDILLEIFNEALPSLEPELKALGVWDDPTRFINTEYVEILEGKEATNVVKYDHNLSIKSA